MLGFEVGLPLGNVGALESPFSPLGLALRLAAIYRSIYGAMSSHYTLVALGMPPRLLRDAPYIMFRKCSFSGICGFAKSIHSGGIQWAVCIRIWFSTTLSLALIENIRSAPTV